MLQWLCAERAAERGSLLHGQFGGRGGADTAEWQTLGRQRFASEAEAVQAAGCVSAAQLLVASLPSKVRRTPMLNGSCTLSGIVQRLDERNLTSADTSYVWKYIPGGACLIMKVSMA